MCKDKNKQTWGIRSGEWGMKEQTKIKMKDEATYLGKRNQYHNSSKCSKKKHKWKKGTKAKTKWYKLQRIKAITSTIYHNPGEC